jgi:P27 family predicted phage terminase small subunit
MKSPPAPAPAPSAPTHLSDRARLLWDQLVPQTATAARRTLLAAALENLDRADAARRTVEAEGMTSKTQSTGALHVHPLLRVETEARWQAVKILQVLGLAAESALEGLL